MLKFHQRLGFLCSIILFCCLLALAGCSRHTAPHYGPDVLAHQKLPLVLDTAIRYRIILLGDGGAPNEDGEPVLKTLGKWAKKFPEKTSIVFLGDNMYPNGLTKEDEDKAVKRLGPQLGVVIESQACGLFIPGNHDWKSGDEWGHRTVIAQEDFINNSLGAQSRCGHPAFLPECGDPGPRMLELPTAAPAVRLVVLNTQWWLHKHRKRYKDPKAIIAALKTQLMTELPVIVVGHHPIETYGPHGGHRDWKSVKSLWRFVDWHFLKSHQNINGEAYKYLINQLNEAFSVPRKTSLLIYAAGHDHSLQVLKGRNTNYLLVSGAASKKKISEVTDGPNTLFAQAHTGFMVVDFLEDDGVLLHVVEPVEKEFLFHQWLKQPSVP